MKKNLIILVITVTLATIMYIISGFNPPPAPNVKNQCPKTEWIDCMPKPNKSKPECRPQYLKWAKENCPNFKGAAY